MRINEQALIGIARAIEICRTLRLQFLLLMAMTSDQILL
ncbi:hypothetical protein BUC_4249 [Burkholderia pseudomallei 576]|nr:hypothetical protein BUC_4249 [Burkholderia pseudomallei 576]